MNAMETLLDLEQLCEALQTLSAYIELPMQLIGEDGTLVRKFGQSTSFCALLKKQIFTGSECFTAHLKAGRYAQALGESYIFACHANLNHIAYPLIAGDKLLGCIIVGPFLMDKPDSTLVSGLAEEYRMTPTLSLELYDELGAVKVIAPARVSQLSKLLGHLLTGLLPDQRPRLMEMQEKLYQQSRINETIQMYKEQGAPDNAHYLYQKETELLTKARTGGTQEAKALLNELLGYVLFAEGGQLETVRERATELTTLLRRVAMESGANADSAFSLSKQYLSAIGRSQSVEALCYLLQDVVVGFMDAAFPVKGNAHVRRALGYVAAHYAQPLTQEQVAKELGLSPRYFSELFQKATGTSLREHLANVRVEESKRLLLATDAPLADVAVATGFSDQSRFCKVFKRVTGVTPGQYRGK